MFSLGRQFHHSTLNIYIYIVIYSEMFASFVLSCVSVVNWRDSLEREYMDTMTSSSLKFFGVFGFTKFISTSGPSLISFFIFSRHSVFLFPSLFSKVVLFQSYLLLSFLQDFTSELLLFRNLQKFKNTATHSSHKHVKTILCRYLLSLASITNIFYFYLFCAFTRITVIGVVGVGNCFCGVPPASFLCQLETVFFDFINRCSKHVVLTDDKEVWGKCVSLQYSSYNVELVCVSIWRIYFHFGVSIGNNYGCDGLFW